MIVGKMLNLRLKIKQLSYQNYVDNDSTYINRDLCSHGGEYYAYRFNEPG